MVTNNALTKCHTQLFFQTMPGPAEVRVMKLTLPILRFPARCFSYHDSSSFILVICSSLMCIAPTGRTHSCLWHMEAVSCGQPDVVKYIPLLVFALAQWVLAERSAMHSGEVNQVLRLQS